VGQKALVRLRSEMNTTVEAEVVRIDQENDRVTEERRVYVRCVSCTPEHQARFLGEQAEIEIIKHIVPEGVFIPLRHVEAFDGRTGRIWTVENGRLALRPVQLGDRLLDGRILISGSLPDGVRAVLTPPDARFAAGRQVSIREGHAQ
jgi:HlyD family secretion protein